MAKINQFKGYEGEPPIPKPKGQVRANVVTVQDGVPVKYPGCDGIGVRVVHPANPKAPAENLGMVMFLFHLMLFWNRGVIILRSVMLSCVVKEP